MQARLQNIFLNQHKFQSMPHSSGLTVFPTRRFARNINRKPGDEPDYFTMRHEPSDDLHGYKFLFPHAAFSPIFCATNFYG